MDVAVDSPRQGDGTAAAAAMTRNMEDLTAEDTAFCAKRSDATAWSRAARVHLLPAERSSRSVVEATARIWYNAHPVRRILAMTSRPGIRLARIIFASASCR